MVQLFYQLLLLSIISITAVSQYATTVLNPLPYALTGGYGGTNIQNVQDYCYLRRDSRSGNPDSNKMKLLNVKYLNDNLYNVTIWISGQQIRNPGLLESLSISEINGPEDRVTLYNPGFIDAPGEILLPDFITTFQSYGVEKNNTTWLPHFQLRYTYTDGLEGSLSSSHDITLGVGCMIVDSSLSGYYWETPASSTDPIVSNDFPTSNTINTPSQTRASYTPATPTAPYTEIHDVQDYCYLRRDDRRRSPDSNKMKLLTVRHLNDNNLYNVTIWVGGQQVNDPGLLENLSITGINGPEDRVTIYNSGFINEPGKILPDFIATFQSYGVEKNDTTWLPHFRLTYTYINGSERSLSFSHDATLGIGCMIVDSSLSGYYWKTPASKTEPIVFNDFPMSNTISTPLKRKASCRVPTSTSAYTDIYDVQDYCYLRRTNRRGNPDSNRMKLLRIRYLNSNLYNVTIWISGQQVSDPGLLESLSITGINGPEDRVTIYNHDLLDQPGEILLPDFITTFQSYGVEKNNTIWLPYFQLTFTYTDGLEGSLSSSHDTNLGIGCSILDSSLSGYYWKSPDTIISTFSDGTFVVSNCAISTTDGHSVSELHTSSSTVSTATSTPAIVTTTRSTEFNAPGSTMDATKSSLAGFTITSFDTRTSWSDNSKSDAIGSTVNSVATGSAGFTKANSITTSSKINGDRSSVSKSNTAGPVVNLTTSAPATFVTNNSGINTPGSNTNESCAARSTVNSTTAGSTGPSMTSITTKTNGSSGSVSSATGFTMNFTTSAPAIFTTTSNISNSSETSSNESEISKYNTADPITKLTTSRPAGFVTSISDISTSGFNNSGSSATASTVSSTASTLMGLATTSVNNSAPKSYGNISNNTGFTFNSTISTPVVFTTTSRNTSISKTNNNKSNAIFSNLNSSTSRPTKFSITSVVTNTPGFGNDKSNTANFTLSIPTSRPAVSATSVRITDAPAINSKASNIPGSTNTSDIINTPKSSSNGSITISSNVNTITRWPVGSAITNVTTNVIRSNSGEFSTAGFIVNSATYTPAGFATTGGTTNFETGSNKSSTYKPTTASFTMGPVTSAPAEFATTRNVTNIPMLNSKESKTLVPTINPATSTLARIITDNGRTNAPRSSGNGSYTFDLFPTTSLPAVSLTTDIGSMESYFSKFSTNGASLEPLSGDFSSNTYSSFNIDTRPTGFQAGSTSVQPINQIGDKNSSNTGKLLVSPIKTVTRTVTTTVLGGCICPTIEDPKEVASTNAD